MGHPALDPSPQQVWHQTVPEQCQEALAYISHALRHFCQPAPDTKCCYTLRDRTAHANLRGSALSFQPPAHTPRAQALVELQAQELSPVLSLFHPICSGTSEICGDTDQNAIYSMTISALPLRSSHCQESSQEGELPG